MIPYIKTSTNITVTSPDGIPQTFSLEHPSIDEILDILVKANSGELSDLAAYEAIIDLVKPRTKFVRKLSGMGTEITLDTNGQLKCTIDDEAIDIDASLLKEIVELYDSNGDITPFLHFIRKLSKNPRKEVADEIWGFMKVCGMTLSPDGDFIAYKNVNNNFTSIYDNSTDNSPGTVVSMRRSAVQHDPNKTCSHGLHFAAWGYLKHYSNGGKTVLLKISPEDVVSIPTDYQNMKGRACKYKVLREVSRPEEMRNVRLMVN